MSALGFPVLINPDRPYWLSSVGADVIHSTIVVDVIDANLANISTINTEDLTVSSFRTRDLDVSGMLVSSIGGDTATFSTLFLTSGDGINPYLRFTTDPSGVQVDGCPIRFDNLVYLTSTINIIQVSTLVDTDIFASNGYFSTLSTGSLSANMVSLNQANISSLFVSSLEGFDISGAEPKDWSLYPTLNSSITFQPGFVLSNVGSNLYFNGFDLTDVSGGGQNWYLFPGLSTIDVSSNIIRGISTLRFQDGGTLTSATGNNLLYNGQNIQYGSSNAVQNWANYPAVANVNMNNNSLSNANTITTSNAVILGDNITSGYTFTNSLGVGGLSLVPVASLTSGGDLSVRNIEVGDSITSLADVNIYGATALPGDSALYVAGGVQFDGGTIHGFSAGLLPVGGINTGRIDMLQAGFNILHPLVGAITTGTALAITAGGAISIAGGGYVEMNTSTLQMINTSQGNKNTTLQAGFLTVDPDVAPTSSIKLFNTLGGGVEIDGGGQGSLQGFSTVIGANLSTINLNVSTINGLPWDISGNDPISNNYSTLTVSSFQVSSIFGVGTASLIGSTININAGLQFTGFGATNNNGKYISSLAFINNLGESFFHEFSNASFSWAGGINPNGYLRIGGGGAYDSYFKNYQNEPALSTSALLTSSIVADFGLDISGAVNINNTINVPLAGGSITFDDGSFVNYTRLEFNDCAGQGTLVAVNNGVDGDGSNCAEIAGLGLRLVAGTGFYEGVRFYTQFPGTGWGLDQLNTNGTTAWEYMYGEETPVDGYIVVINGMSSFSGTTDLAIGLSTPTINFTNILKGDMLSTLALNVSSINGAPVDGNSFDNQFSTLGTSSFTFSTATSVGSNANFNIPLFIDYDQATNISTGGVAIAIQGHNLATGAVVNQIQMGCRGNGDNYIMSVWPGQNLEDLYIDATDLTVRDSDGFSTIINLDPYGLITNGAISAPSILVSSINGNDARVAYTNNLMLSTMELYNASTTLMYWSTITTSSNINTSGYDVVPGLDGVFKVGASFQFVSGGASDEVEFFFIKNGNVISQSGGIQAVANNDEIVSYVEMVEPLANGDTIQVGCYTTGTGVYVSTINGNVIQSPAVILTMYKVD